MYLQDRNAINKRADKAVGGILFQIGDLVDRAVFAAWSQFYLYVGILVIIVALAALARGSLFLLHQGGAL